MLPRPASIVAAVVVTFAVAGVMRLSTRGMSVERASETSSRLDSARYQREIVALEDALYKNEPPSMTDFMTISGALHELGFAIAGRELNPTSRQVAEDVSVLAASTLPSGVRARAVRRSSTCRSRLPVALCQTTA